MVDPRVRKLAEILVDYSTKVKKGDRVLIDADVDAHPLILEVYKLCLQRGAYPRVKIRYPGLAYIFFKYASAEQVRYFPEVEYYEIKHTDVYIRIRAPRNLRELESVDPTKISERMKVLKPILSKIDILLLNQEEASLLTKIPYQKEKEIFKKLNELVNGIVIMTKGAKGAVVSDGSYLWQARPSKVSVVEKTGAGDAFGAGFLKGFMEKGDIAFSLQLGLANATACIQKIGAKQGFLKKDQPWKKVKVTKKRLK